MAIRFFCELLSEDNVYRKIYSFSLTRLETETETDTGNGIR